MLYSKKGSIPKPQTDGTDGWIEVPDAPIPPDGKEVVWWYPPGWVIRDIKPCEGDWLWSQSQECWIECTAAIEAVPQEVVTETAGISMASCTAGEAFGVIDPESSAISLDSLTAGDTLI
jgi:hypothetical protein